MSRRNRRKWGTNSLFRIFHSDGAASKSHSWKGCSPWCLVRRSTWLGLLLFLVSWGSRVSAVPCSPEVNNNPLLFSPHEERDCYLCTTWPTGLPQDPLEFCHSQIWWNDLLSYGSAGWRAGVVVRNLEVLLCSVWWCPTMVSQWESPISSYTVRFRPSRSNFHISCCYGIECWYIVWNSSFKQLIMESDFFTLVFCAGMLFTASLLSLNWWTIFVVYCSFAFSDATR